MIQVCPNCNSKLKTKNTIIVDESSRIRRVKCEKCNKYYYVNIIEDIALDKETEDLYKSMYYSSVAESLVKKYKGAD